MSTPHVVNSAPLKCSMGLSPSTLAVLPLNAMQSGYQNAANIMDFKPMVNILPFGMCNTPSNPAVATATSTAGGVLTPQPCIPVVTAPWTPGAPSVLLANQPALNMTSQCVCQWGGVIKPAAPGETTELIP
ncbi:MAG: DUF4280 domain-containing protein [Comamonadaceae bacterium]|nr:MAG: DUF4280 domain-containing protein [Comamonadaceae bacterium]